MITKLKLGDPPILCQRVLYNLGGWEFRKLGKRAALVVGEAHSLAPLHINTVHSVDV
jgi:hypothetical protein